MENNLSKKIKELRLKKNMTLEELGKKINVSTQTIFKYENGIIKNIKYSTIEKLSKIFDVTPQYLLGLSEDEEAVPSIEELKKSVQFFYQNKKISDESKDKFFREIQEIYFKERLKK